LPDAAEMKRQKAQKSEALDIEFSKMLDFDGKCFVYEFWGNKGPSGNSDMRIIFAVFFHFLDNFTVF